MPKKKYKDFLKKAGVGQEKPTPPIKMGESSADSQSSALKEPKEDVMRISTTTMGSSATIGVGVGKSEGRANIERASFVVNQHSPREIKQIYKSMDDKVQKELEVHGISVCIEWPAGLPRMYGKNNDKEGKTSYVDYGYFKGTKSADGGGVDVYVGPQHESKKVFILLQKPTSWDVQHGIIDPEQKYMLGFGSIDDAIAGYKASMPEEWFLSIGEISFEDFLQVIKVAQDRKSTLISKAMSGIGFDTKPGAKEKAALAGLIILPDNLTGTNCANCRFYVANKENQDIGYCKHAALEQTVGGDFCCNHWDADGAKVAKSVDSDEDWQRLNMGGDVENWISKSNNASADWRTGFKQTQDQLKKYLEGEDSASANQQTMHTAEMSSKPKKVEDEVVKSAKTPRPTSEGIMSREHERKANRTPLVKKTRLVDAGQTSAIPLFPNRLNTIKKNKRKIMKSILESPIPMDADDIKIIFNM